MDSTYDALLLVSFGGPEGMDEVMPFLANVLRGRNVPPERLLEVAHHYERFGGVSPINGQNRALLAALQAELDRHGPRLPVYWGNRNWHPLLPDTLARMTRDGVRRALAFVTSAYSAYSSCRQYLDNIRDARAAAGPGAPEVDKIRVFYDHPGFVEPTVERVRGALLSLPEARRAEAHLSFTAHSIPLAMAASCDYVIQLDEACRLVAERVPHARWRLVYQSRSGPPSQPWLEPDVVDHLRALAAEGVRDVVVSPIGFVSDHMEILYDLDTEARETAERLGLSLIRTPTVGTHPAFVSMIRELIVERTTPGAPRRALGARGPSPDVCLPGCCPAGAGRPAPAGGLLR